ncbi:MAG: DUF4956 domain-containing protein [Lachnospiraceae bacterium]|nr:DUF4956 domain-containing protein [Lachnospiraceae bacterium]
MSVKDIIKKSFLETFSIADINTTDILIVLLMTCILAVYIFFIYRIITRKSFYNKSFNISLAALALITAAIIITIQSSVVVSLGMVGALSIVRFRTAIKDPMDLVFLFWSISVGIICGAGLYEVAILLSIIVTIIIFVLDRIPVAKSPMILVVNSSDIKSETSITNLVAEFSRFYKVKSRNMTSGQLDMVIEVRVKEEAEFIQKMNEVNGVQSVSLLSHDGEVTF